MGVARPLVNGPGKFKGKATQNAYVYNLDENMVCNTVNKK